jgi:hypothetical protein
MPFQEYHFGGKEKSGNRPTSRHLFRQLLQRLADEDLERGLSVAGAEHLLDHLFHVGGSVPQVGQGREGVVQDLG